MFVVLCVFLMLVLNKFQQLIKIQLKLKTMLFSQFCTLELFKLRVLNLSGQPKF